MVRREQNRSIPGSYDGVCGRTEEEAVESGKTACAEDHEISRFVTELGRDALRRRPAVGPQPRCHSCFRQHLERLIDGALMSHSLVDVQHGDISPGAER